MRKNGDNMTICGLVRSTQLNIFYKIVILNFMFKIFGKIFEEIYNFVDSRQETWNCNNNEQQQSELFFNDSVQDHLSYFRNEEDISINKNYFISKGNENI